MNFYIELSLIDSVLRLEKLKGYLRVDTELRQKLRGLMTYVWGVVKEYWHCVYLETLRPEIRKKKKEKKKGLNMTQSAKPFE